MNQKRKVGHGSHCVMQDATGGATGCSIPSLNPLLDKQIEPQPQPQYSVKVTNNLSSSMGSSWSSLQTQSEPKKGGRSFTLADLVRKKKRTTLKEKTFSNTHKSKTKATAKKSVGTFGLLDWMHE
jgi:hypothetical protein